MESFGQPVLVTDHVYTETKPCFAAEHESGFYCVHLNAESAYSMCVHSLYWAR